MQSLIRTILSGYFIFLHILSYILPYVEMRMNNKRQGPLFTFVNIGLARVKGNYRVNYELFKTISPVYSS